MTPVLKPNYSNNSLTQTYLQYRFPQPKTLSCLILTHRFCEYYKPRNIPNLYEKYKHSSLIWSQFLVSTIIPVPKDSLLKEEESFIFLIDLVMKKGSNFIFDEVLHLEPMPRKGRQYPSLNLEEYIDRSVRAILDLLIKYSPPHTLLSFPQSLTPVVIRLLEQSNLKMGVRLNLKELFLSQLAYVTHFECISLEVKDTLIFLYESNAV